MSSDSNLAAGGPADFRPTQWSMVLAAGEERTSEANEALSQLCTLYWYPLYAHARRHGHSPHDAEDLIQGFFECFLKGKHVQSADPQKGKFRSFLLTLLKHHMVGEWRKRQTVKQAGNATLFSLDMEDAEGRLARELGGGESPETLYDRRWARTVIDRVKAQLKEDYAARGREKQFERLRPYLTGEVVPESYDALASDLEMSKDAMRTELHRMRRSFGKLLRTEVAHTVQNPDDIEDELRHLLAAWGGGPSGATGLSSND